MGGVALANKGPVSVVLTFWSNSVIRLVGKRRELARSWGGGGKVILNRGSVGKYP